MSFNPDYPHTRTVIGSDYLTIPALPAFGVTITDVAASSSNDNTINVGFFRVVYASVGGTLLINNGPSSGQTRIITGTTATRVVFNNQPILNINNGNSYSIIMNQSQFGIPVSSTRLRLFNSAIVSGTINWATQLRDASILITSGASINSIIQIRHFNTGTYTATLYSPLSILPAAGDTWQLIAMTFQGNSANNVANTITLSSNLNGQLIRPFPVGSKIIGLTSPTNTYGNVCNLVSTTALTTVNVSKVPTFGSASTCLFRVFNGSVPFNLQTQIMSDSSTYSNSNVRLNIPFYNGVPRTVYVAKVYDVKKPSDPNTVLAKNSLYVSLSRVILSGNEVEVKDNDITETNAYWVENYSALSINGLQFTSEYFK